MKINETISVMESVFKNKERSVTLYLNGKPGIGKTASIAQAAKKCGLDLMVINLTTCESVDLRGLPQVRDGKTTWCSPLPKTGRGVLVLDEISSAPRDVQVAAHHIVWAEEGSDVSIGSGWHIVLTGNRADDKSTHHPLASPLRNRLVHVDFEEDVDSWVSWANDNDINPAIIGFLKWRPDLLYAKEIPSSGAFNTPRSWAIASDILTLDTTGLSEFDLLSGTIGNGQAREFCAYLKLVRELPSLDEILKNQEGIAIPSSPPTLYALVILMIKHTLKDGVSYMKFLSRCPAEYAMLYIKGISGSSFKIRNDEDCMKWIANHKNSFDLSNI